jgi:hypothetical protein
MSKETLSTSDKEVPKIKLALEEKYEEEKKQINVGQAKEPLHPDNIGQNVVDDLPQPAGYRILVLPFTPREKQKVEYYFLKNL